MRRKGGSRSPVRRQSVRTRCTPLSTPKNRQRVAESTAPKEESDNNRRPARNRSRSVRRGRLSPSREHREGYQRSSSRNRNSRHRRSHSLGRGRFVPETYEVPLTPNPDGKEDRHPRDDTKKSKSSPRRRFSNDATGDLSNFMSGSTYNLHYNLFPTAVCSPRENKFGTISLRLRMEMEDERALLLSNFVLPQSVYVNVHNKKELEVIKQTVEGGIDTKKYSLKTINSHVDELMSYLTIYYALVDAFLSLILWRGVTAISLPVPSLSTRSIKWTNVFIPLHSLVAFICTVSLVENPDLLPSFYFGCVGW